LDSILATFSRESHQPCHVRCIACSKEAIVRAISRYRELDAHWRDRSHLPIHCASIPAHTGQRAWN